MPRSTPPEPPCPNEAQHTIHPRSYLAHGEWAEQMLLTHDQRKCRTCGAYALWKPKPGVTDLSRPALYSGGCATCDAYYEARTLIRTDDAGGWIASCCPEVADA